MDNLMLNYLTILAFWRVLLFKGETGSILLSFDDCAGTTILNIAFPKYCAELVPYEFSFQNYFIILIHLCSLLNNHLVVWWTQRNQIFKAQDSSRVQWSVEAQLPVLICRNFRGQNQFRIRRGRIPFQRRRSLTQKWILDLHDQPPRQIFEYVSFWDEHYKTFLP